MGKYMSVHARVASPRGHTPTKNSGGGDRAPRLRWISQNYTNRLNYTTNAVMSACSLFTKRRFF